MRNSLTPLLPPNTLVELPGLEKSDCHLPLSEISPLGQTNFGTMTTSQERNVTHSLPSNGSELQGWVLINELVNTHDNTLHPNNSYRSLGGFELKILIERVLRVLILCQQRVACIENYQTLYQKNHSSGDTIPFSQGMSWITIIYFPLTLLTVGGA